MYCKTAIDVNISPYYSKGKKKVLFISDHDIDIFDTIDWKFLNMADGKLQYFPLHGCNYIWHIFYTCHSTLTCALMIICMCAAILRVVSCSCSVILRCFVISVESDQVIATMSWIITPWSMYILVPAIKTVEKIEPHNSSACTHSQVGHKGL